MISISIIVAHASNHVIGKDGKLPWHIPADLKYFKKLTYGSPIIMGRKTFESIGRPLPGRHNIIITRNSEYHNDDCAVVFDFHAALKEAGDFVDPSNMNQFECDQCKTLFGSQMEAYEHANNFQHWNFNEI